MTSGWRRSVGAGVLTALVSAAGLHAQQPAEPAASGGDTDTGEPQVTVPITSSDLARIRRALGSEPAVRIDDAQLRFYMQILVKQPTFAEFAKGYDFVNGPTRRGNPMTHNEFLSMVTPREMQSSVGITARETLEFALTNWLAQSLVKRAFEDLQNAKDEREIQEIRDRIERELSVIRGAGAH